MKTRLSLLAIALFAGLTIASAQTLPSTSTPVATGSPFSYSILWDFSIKKFDVLGGYNAGTVTKLFGKPWLNGSVLVLGGTTLATTGSNGATGGGALVFSGPLADSIKWQIGPSALFTAGEKFHGALWLGISGSLGK